MDVSMSVCRVGPVGLGSGGRSGIRFMANFVRSRALVCRGLIYCCGLIRVVICVSKLSVGTPENEQRVDRGQQLP